MAKPKMTARDVEIRVARYFNPRVNLIVPNVSWGFGLNYEADLVIVRPSWFCDEIEIKVTIADLKADAKKKHIHDGKMFKRLWFAMPDYLFPPIKAITKTRRIPNSLNPSKYVIPHLPCFFKRLVRADLVFVEPVDKIKSSGTNVRNSKSNPDAAPLSLIFFVIEFLSVEGA